MNWQDLKGLKYYIASSVLLISFFVYSGITGWKWFNTTETQSARPAGRTGYIYRYHK